MLVLLTSIHVLSAIVIILVILLQSGSSADLAGAFGGGGSQTAFGPRGAGTVLSKITTGAAIIFMITSFTLAIMATKKSSNSVLEGTTNVPVAPQTNPNTPPPSPMPSTPSAQPGTVPGKSAPSSGSTTVNVEIPKTGKGVTKTVPAPGGKKDAHAAGDQKKSSAPEKK
ncbi:MAG: preprotein translocase subunit SecG [Acidobacteriia bacterium]|nr:preprotein translocase subunit SecG [Terriglobia bacterium]